MGVVPDRPARAADRRLAGPLRRAIRSRGLADTAALAVDAAVELGRWRAPGGIPARATVDRVLAQLPDLWRLADGRWVHLPAAVDDRVLAVRRSSGTAVGLLWLVGVLGPVALRLHGWDRIPISTAAARGVGEVVRRDGCTAVALPSWLVPTEGALLTVTAGPEGLRLGGCAADPAATAQARAALAITPRSWPPTDRLLVALAQGPTLCRGAVDPDVLDGALTGSHPPWAASA